MARMNISVPDAIKARMDALGEKVNWSAVAADAFEAKVNEIVKTKKVRTMNEVIERLRASKQTEMSEAYNAGRAFGSTWAQRQASFGELERVAGTTGDEISLDHDGAALRLAQIALGPEHDGATWQELRDFWMELDVSDADLANGDWLEGFIDGAESIYDEVAEVI